MIVTVDCEGHDGQLLSISYGREDGTSASLMTSDPRQAMAWIIDELSGEYQGCKQSVGSFHFNWDTAVLSKAFDPNHMELVHKAGARHVGLICGTRHKNGGRPCHKLHRYDPLDIEAIITDGGEGQVIAWDIASQLAFAATPKRRFYIEHRPKGDLYAGWRRVDIHDNGTAFYGGLEQVIEDWQPELSDAQKAIIAWGKGSRKHGFIDGTPEMIQEYSEAECVAAARCIRKLMVMITKVAGIPLKHSRLYGAGSIAAEAFRYHHVPTRSQSDDDREMFTWARMGYFGGLIETPVVGIVDGITDEEDINSAYPAAQITLPCMRKGHGRWHQYSGNMEKLKLPADTVGYAKVSWRLYKPRTNTPPFLVRHKVGSVFQPEAADDIIVTLPEYLAAVKRFGWLDIKASVVKWWAQDCKCPNAFLWMEELYQSRIEIKQAMKQLEKGCPEWYELNHQQEAIKLILVSCYGKLAQQRPSLGKYTNLHYASYITGRTRSLVRKKTWYQEGKHGIVVYQHTDSVLSINGQPVDDGPVLGGFKVEKPSIDLMLFQPGLVMALGGGKTASRGCNESAFQQAAREWAETVDFTQHPSTWPPLTVTGDRMISRRLAIHQGKPELAGTFRPHTLTIGIMDGKRVLDGAKRIKGKPRAWILPPQKYAWPEWVATINDLVQFYSAVERRMKEGEFDEDISRLPDTDI